MYAPWPQQPAQSGPGEQAERQRTAASCLVPKVPTAPHKFLLVITDSAFAGFALRTRGLAIGLGHDTAVCQGALEEQSSGVQEESAPHDSH